MKANKKVVISTATVLGAAALIAGGTIAYFTDNESKTNTFTVGNVDVTLYESQLHRVNANMATSGRHNSLTSGPLASNPHYCLPYVSGTSEVFVSYCTPNITALNEATGVVSAWDNGHVRSAHTVTTNNGTHSSGGQFGVFSDEQIIADATGTPATSATASTPGNYAGYVADEYQNLVPGKEVRKFVYVKNTGSSPAYARVKISIPKSIAGFVTLKVPHTAVEAVASTSAKVDNINGVATEYAYITPADAKTSAYVNYINAPTNTNKDTAGLDIDSVSTGDNVVLTFVYSDALEPGEMTYWSPINVVKINKSTMESDFDAADLVKYRDASQGLGITVDVDAIQSEGFASAAAAFAEFDGTNNAAYEAEHDV